jgi:hypothetical protein
MLWLLCFLLVLECFPNAACRQTLLTAVVNCPPQEFDSDGACKLVNAAPNLLAVRSAIWQCNLAVMRLLGVADPHAIAHKNGNVLVHKWLSPAILLKLLALQRFIPGKMSYGQIIVSWATYVASKSAKRIVGRLLYLEQAGLLQQFVQTKPNKRAEGEPEYISVGDVATASDAKLAGLVAAAASQLRCKPVSRDSIAAEVEAFEEGLKDLAAWQELLADANNLRQELKRQLPPEQVAALEVAGKRGKETEDNAGQLA